jgi:hypothetical protein
MRLEHSLVSHAEKETVFAFLAQENCYSLSRKEYHYLHATESCSSISQFFGVPSTNVRRKSPKDYPLFPTVRAKECESEPFKKIIWLR